MVYRRLVRDAGRRAREDTRGRLEIQDGTGTKRYSAREIGVDERVVWWRRAVAEWPAFEEYAARTKRVIPLIELTPAG